MLRRDSFGLDRGSPLYIGHIPALSLYCCLLL